MCMYLCLHTSSAASMGWQAFFLWLSAAHLCVNNSILINIIERQEIIQTFAHLEYTYIQIVFRQPSDAMGNSK